MYGEYDASTHATETSVASPCSLAGCTSAASGAGKHVLDAERYWYFGGACSRGKTVSAVWRAVLARTHPANQG